jgi:hypothetical protein
MNLQTKITDLIYTHVTIGIEDAAGAVVAMLPADHAASFVRIAALEKALLTTRALVVEGAVVGFNCHDGDWADRLYKNNGNISRALKETT